MTITKVFDMTHSKKFRRLIISIALAFLVVVGCSLESPKAPRWDLPVNIPLMDSTFTVAKLIEDTENIVTLESGLVGFRFEGEFDTTRVGDYLNLDDISRQYGIQFAGLQIPLVPAGFDRYLFSQLTSQAVDKHNTTSAIDAFSFADVEGESYDASEFVRGKILSGKLRFTVTNGLPVPLRQVRFRLVDKNTDTILKEIVFPEVAAAATLKKEIDAAGLTLSPATVWRMSGNSPGSGGTAVPIDQNSPVLTATELVDFQIEEIESVLPEIAINHTQWVPLYDRAAIKRGEFQSGIIRLKISNTTEIPSTVVIQLNQLKRKDNGQPLQFPLDLAGGSSSVLEYRLADYVAHMTLPPPGGTQTTPITVVGKFLETSSGPVRISDGDAFRIDFSMRDVRLSYVEGWLKEQEVKLPRQETRINRPKGFGGFDEIKIKDGRLLISVFSTIAMPIRFTGTIEGYGEQNRHAALAIDERIAAGQSGKEVETKLPPFTPANSGILGLLNLYPERIVTSGTGWVGDGVTVGTVTANDYIRVKYLLESAGSAVWQDKIITPDTTKFIIEPANAPGQTEPDATALSADLTRRLQKIEFHASVENHLPIGLRLVFRMAHSLDRLGTNPDIILGPLQVQAGELKASGTVVKATQQEQTLVLDREDLQLFKNDGDTPQRVYVAPEITLLGSSKEIQLFGSDYVRVQAFVKIISRVGDE